MLEERMNPDLRRWGFLLSEMVLIVASILLAFALDSWWGERKDRAEEVEILHGLQEEFRLNRSLLANRVEQHRSDLENMHELLDAAIRGQWTSKRISIDQALASSIAPPTTDPGNGVLDALIGSGRFEMLGSRSLRARLAAWAGVFGEVHDDEVMSRELVFDRIVPYLVENGVPISGPMSQWPGEWHKTPRSISESPQQLGRLLNDSRFSVLLEAHVGFKMHTTGEYQVALDAIDAILAEIDASLAQH